MNTVIKFSALALIVFFVSCKGTKKETGDAGQKDTLAILAANLFEPLPEMAQSQQNDITLEKISLGKVLFYDTRLSSKGNNSCNSCHNLSTYGVDNQPTSVGDDGMRGNRNSPTVMNAALAFVQFWDGRAKDVEEQAGGPILNPAEMNIKSPEALVKKLKETEGYPKLFSAAFPDDPNPVSYQNIQLAIGAFERTLITPSHFDSYLLGETDKLNDQEKRGMQAFINTGCTTCHSGVLLGDNMFQKFGLFGHYAEYTKSQKEDMGRYDVTKNDADKYIFKVPTLRNIKETYPYFHDGSVANLGDAVTVMAKVQLNKDLDQQKINDITAFLASTTGKIPESALEIPDLP